MRMLVGTVRKLRRTSSATGTATLSASTTIAPRRPYARTRPTVGRSRVSTRHDTGARTRAGEAERDADEEDARIRVARLLEEERRRDDEDRDEAARRREGAQRLSGRRRARGHAAVVIHSRALRDDLPPARRCDRSRRDSDRSPSSSRRGCARRRMLSAWDRTSGARDGGSSCAR